MKTAVSIPNSVFEKAERFARRTKTSRSEIYSRALSEYLARHVPDQVTEAMDRALEELGQAPNGFVSAAALRTLDRIEW